MSLFILAKLIFLNYNYFNMNELKLFNLKLNTFGFNEVLDKIDEFIKGDKCAHIVTLSTEMVMHSEKDKLFSDIENSASLVTPDSAGIVWAVKKLYKKRIEKVSGVDLVREICRISGVKGWKLFILGSTEESLLEAVRKLKEKYKDINIAGCHNGYFKDDEKVLNYINEKSPDILFVALGSPRQEFWISKHKEKLNAKVAIGVGGSFDVISGKFKRAPQWMVKSSLEWLYRLITQPKRFIRMLAIPRFMTKVYLKLLSGKK
ncbi:MAG: WecB/TagA/CpsF family glycosyltransferase [Armatimonadota bacterium]